MLEPADAEKSTGEASSIRSLIALLNQSFKTLTNVTTPPSKKGPIVPLLWIEDVHSCHPGIVEALSAGIIDSNFYFPVIMTTSEHSEEFKLLVGKKCARESCFLSSYMLIAHLLILSYIL